MTGGPMLPPKLVRRLVLAPLVVIVELVLIVLSPVLAVLTLICGLIALPRGGQMRSLRLTAFRLVGLVAEIKPLFVRGSLWLVPGSGRRLHTEPYQARHY